MRQVSDVDYTQPFGQRGGQDLGWVFHYVLLVSQVIFLIIFLIGAFFKIDCVTYLLLLSLFFYATLSKRRWLITLYQISFWLQFVLVILSVIGVILTCFFFESMGGLFFLILLVMGPALLVAGVVFLVNLIVTPIIIKYYKKRQAYLR